MFQDTPSAAVGIRPAWHLVDIPPRARFRRFRREVNALKFAATMEMQGRLIPVPVTGADRIRRRQPYVTQTFAGAGTFHFVNYRRKSVEVPE